MKINLSDNERLVFVGEMSAMLTAGIPLAEAIDSLGNEARGNTKKLINAVSADIANGQTLASSFSKIDGAFDTITINLLSSAEESGNLEKTLSDLKQNINEQIEFNNKVKAALTYPMVILSVFAGVFTLILTFVVPRIATVFARLRMNLPLPTRILIIVSNTLLTYTPYVLGGLAIIIMAAIILFKTKRRQLISFLSGMPVISKLAYEIDFARITHGLHLLLTSGIPIAKALELVARTATKREVRAALAKAQEEVTGGNTLSSALKLFPKIIPGTMVRITEAGEKSGTLEKSMADLSEYFENRVDSSLKTVTTLIEPVMLVFVGLLVGGMMLAIISPIYNLIGQIKSR